MSVFPLSNITNQVKISKFLLFIFLILCSLKLTYCLQDIMDVLLYDESTYLYNGYKLKESGLPPAEYAPLYAIWYNFLSKIQPDKIQLFYLNQKILTIIPVLLLFLTLNKLRVNPLIAFTSSYIYLIAMGNLYYYIKPSHFAIQIILLFFLLSLFIKSDILKLLINSLGLLLATYSRPDYFLSFIILIFISFVYTYIGYSQKKLNKSFVIVLILFLFLYITIFKIFGNPLGGNRSFTAFMQHFSINYCYWTKSSLKPTIDFIEVQKKVFKESRTILQAFSNNPKWFIIHILTNILRYPLNFFDTLFAHFNILIPPKNLFMTTLEGLLFLVCGFVLLIKNRKFINFKNIDNNLLIFLCVVAFPAIVSSLIIFPKIHYLLIHTIIFLIIISKIFPENILILNIRKSIFIGIIFLLLTPTLQKNYYYTWYYSPEELRNKTVLPNLQTIQKIQNLNINSKKQVNLLEAEGGYYIYLGENFKRIAEYEKLEPFDVFINKHKINMIVVSNEMLSDIRFKDDNIFKAFLNNYQQYDFSQFFIKRTSRILFVRNDLLIKH